MMPGMDGYEFHHTLRESRCDLPILMLSARQLPDNIEHGFLAGTDDYITSLQLKRNFCCASAPCSGVPALQRTGS